ncbi:Protein kinase domain-containing protein [Psidium guajava]|nr:Protein kinase domain-containing protein [Psidium guajava]
MENRDETKKTIRKPRSRLPPKRGQIKVKIFKLLANQIVKLAKMGGQRQRKACCCNCKFASVTPLEHK